MAVGIILVLVITISLFCFTVLATLNAESKITKRFKEESRYIERRTDIFRSHLEFRKEAGRMGKWLRK